MEVDKSPLLITLPLELYRLFVVDIHGRYCPVMPLLWECEKKLDRAEYRHVLSYVYIVAVAQEYKTVTLMPQTPEYLRDIIQKRASASDPKRK